MILADKIINERKKNGWSQEELAEQLSVSRQSISKWEGAQAIPDIQKIIKMAELFGVTTDYLLKDEMEPESVAPSSNALTTAEGDVNVIRVSMEEANEYLDLEEKVTPRIANMVSVCILAPALLIFMIAASLIPGFPLGEIPCLAIGLTLLLLLIATAVFFFIIDASKLKRFEYLENSPIETMYGVTGMVNEKKKEHEQNFVIFTALGVILCILSVVPLIIASLLSASEYLILIMVSLMLLTICGGVNLLVRAGCKKSAYDKLLQEGDYTINEKKKSPVISSVCSVYWTLTTAIFLTWSFVADSWGISWIVWPIAGVFFAVVLTITKSLVRTK